MLSTVFQEKQIRTALPTILRCSSNIWLVELAVTMERFTATAKNMKAIWWFIITTLGYYTIHFMKRNKHTYEIQTAIYCNTVSNLRRNSGSRWKGIIRNGSFTLEILTCTVLIFQYFLIWIKCWKVMIHLVAGHPGSMLETLFVRIFQTCQWRKLMGNLLSIPEKWAVTVAHQCYSRRGRQS